MGNCTVCFGGYGSAGGPHTCPEKPSDKLRAENDLLVMHLKKICNSKDNYERRAWIVKSRLLLEGKA